MTNIKKEMQGVMVQLKDQVFRMKQAQTHRG